MKHLVISSVLLVTSLLYSIGTMLWASEVAESTAMLLEQAKEQAENGNTDEASALVCAASDYWAACSSWLCITVCHDEVELVTVELAKLNASREQDEFLVICAGLLTELALIEEMEKPSLKNIL